MRLSRFKFLAPSIAALGTRGVVSGASGPPPDVRGEERTRVPSGRRLADVVADHDRRAHPGAYPRRYEVEADDGTAGGATLAVERVRRTAVTRRTTYGFRPGREFDAERVGDFSILASNPAEAEGLVVLSVNKSNGVVRGLQRGKTGHMRRISADATGRRLRMERTGGSLEESLAEKNWECGAAHAHDDDVDPARPREHAILGDGHDHANHHHSQSVPLNPDFARTSIRSVGSSSGASFSSADGQAITGWLENPNYSFHVDLSIDIDKSFIEKQGSAEAAVEYINVLVSAANVVFEHEVDAHLHIVHIQETDIYDQLTTTKQALKEMRLHPKPYSTDEHNSKIILHHAMLGRYVGGGIAFIDSICDERWGYGVTSDISGRLDDIDELVLFDFFIVTHEIGHSLGSGHTFDAYDPPVDVCGACTVKPQGGEERNGVTIDGLPRENAATLMSYCNFCDGGLSNIAITLGGVWDGAEPRTDLERWDNHPDIKGDVSVEPRRVSHNVWRRLSSKGECVRPPSDPVPTRGCNDDGDCDDGNACTIDACDETDLCAVTETLDNCCGNGKCEAGEGRSCTDCGPFHVKAPSFCDRDNCHALDGFMIDVGLSDDAKRKIFIRSIRVAYSSPKNDDVATIDVYVATKGSYVGKEKSASDWEKVGTATVSQYNQKRETRLAEIPLQRRIRLGAGDRRGLYLAASEDVVLFGQRPYSVRDGRGVELRSSLAVAGLFGDGIDGFSLSCEVGYTLDDGSEKGSDDRAGGDAGGDPDENGSEGEWGDSAGDGVGDDADDGSSSGADDGLDENGSRDGSVEGADDGDGVTPPTASQPAPAESDSEINLVSRLETLPPSSANPITDLVSPPSPPPAGEEIEDSSLREDEEGDSVQARSNPPAVGAKASSRSTYPFLKPVCSIFTLSLIVCIGL